MNNLPSINISTKYRLLRRPSISSGSKDQVPNIRHYKIHLLRSLRCSIPLVYNTQRQYSGAFFTPTYISTEDKARIQQTKRQAVEKYRRMNHRKTVLKLRTIPSHLA